MKRIVTVILAITAYCVAWAQQPAVVASDKTGWHKIAETTVDLTKERDEVAVIGADRFAAVKLKITDAAVDIRDMVIHYEKGDSQLVNVRTPITGPGETKEIDLKNGAERSIKKIVFVYKTVANRNDKKAHVEIWGRKTNEVK